MEKFILFSVIKDDNLRNVIIGAIVSVVTIIMILILFVVYILTAPIALLNELVTNPEMLATILSFKSEYQYLIAGSGGIYGWPLSEEYPIDESDPTNLFGTRVHPIYGDVRFHSGVDIQAPNGSECYAIGNGTVIQTGDSGGWGYIVELDLGKNSRGQTITCKYCHLTPGSINVKIGDPVKRGQVLALTGCTGNTQGGHIHFEMKEDGEYCDPLKYISIGGGNYGDLDLFYHCVEAEAGGEPYEGKIAVAQCIIYSSQRKGVSLDDAITAQGQYSCVSDGRIYDVSPSAESIKAADEALAGKRVLEEGTEYFINYKTAEISWWHQTLKLTGTIGNHTFYKSW
ncbi:peptidoglycan DD-metalloendopeptidase family protein [Acetobacterium woodii]|uniref:Peptidase M23B n=1 Tax=Acetobacterium woodii (strain ATCC 29683 / DSM 1030 / JCM 2381 / KCTC 1655 / WB1) TaxID=931626 RepID=H6LDG5_ACEWD|nr:peptidoglycan DD-metalloendopeptidase family protein [Acetobacterium woodii]AFA47937.1 peptidase M23B [Acetobacterium woodii DSM 1030]